MGETLPFIELSLGIFLEPCRASMSRASAIWRSLTFAIVRFLVNYIYVRR